MNHMQTSDETRQHILVVEDEPQIADLLVRILKKDGFSVAVADSLATARASLAERVPQLSLVDLALPDGRGLSLICESLVNHRCGIIVVTGSHDETDLVLGLELGADDYVTKPFRPRALLARIHSVLRRVSVPAPASGTETPLETLAFGPFRLAQETRQLFDRNDVEVALTTAEYSLLMTFIKYRGETVDRDQLNQELYGGNRHGNPRAVDGLVSRLRRKFASHGGAQPLIRTMHRRGYRFVG